MSALSRKLVKKMVKKASGRKPNPLPDTRVGIWQAHKLIYVRVPKCANTTIMNSIEGVEKRRRWASDIADPPPGWTTFSFVRNPWDRLVSTYRNKASRDSTSPRINDGVYEGFVQAGIPVRADMSFAEFCEVICDFPDESTDKHLRSQSSFLIHEQKLIVQILGKLETFDRDWDAIRSRLALAVEPIHLNRTSREHYSRYYDPYLVKLVGDRYAADVKNFDYDF